MKTLSPNIRLFFSDTSWIETAALDQLWAVAALPGVRLAAGLPDLHPGKGAPIGAALASDTHVYPFLVGNDVGCGMDLWQTDLPRRKLKLDRWAERLDGLEAPWAGDRAAWLEERSVSETLAADKSLGTIGAGNHFAELQAVEEVTDPAGFATLGLEASALCVLVHSGSRGLGDRILRAHTERHGAGGLEAGGEEAHAYLARHDHAVAWARANRALIAARFGEGLGTEIRPVLDSAHNAVVPATLDGAPTFLHRKGAAPADTGSLVIPGSRGALSYLVQPTGGQARNLFSLAHGAGRKWTRADSRARLATRYPKAEALARTTLGGRVVCEDRALLYEEAPEAYKDVGRVVADLVEHGLVRVLATLRPLITYKTRRPPDRHRQER